MRSVFLSLAVALLAIWSFGCGDQRTEIPPTVVVSVKEREGVDHTPFAFIGAVDFENILRVQQVLEDAGIPGGMEGSVLYGIAVPQEFADKARELISKDSRAFHYTFYEDPTWADGGRRGSQPPRN